VDNRMTLPSAFSIYSLTNAGTTVGTLTVNDGNGNTRVKAAAGVGGAIALLMSYGPDGHGAFQYGGLLKAVGNANANTLTNCHCDSSAAASTTYPATTFIQAPATSTTPTDPGNFDDIVRYYVRSSFLNNTDTSLTR